MEVGDFGGGCRAAVAAEWAPGYEEEIWWSLCVPPGRGGVELLEGSVSISHPLLPLPSPTSKCHSRERDGGATSDQHPGV